MPTPPPRRVDRGRSLLAAVYVLCWVVGLSLGTPEITPDADASMISSAYSTSSTVVVFAVLVHGVAGVLLVALGAVLPPLHRRRWSVTLASAAAALSLLQLIGELQLASGAGSPDAGTVWTVITVADGAKMLVLAAWIAVVHDGRSSRGPIVSVLSVTTGLALVASGVGYLARSPSLMAAAYVSLPLLLLWVLAAAWGRGRRPLSRET